MKAKKLIALIAVLAITLSATSMVATAAENDVVQRNTTVSYTVPGGDVSPTDASWYVTIPSSVEMTSVNVSSEKTISLTEDGTNAFTSNAPAVEVEMASENEYILELTVDDDTVKIQSLGYQVALNNDAGDIVNNAHADAADDIEVVTLGTASEESDIVSDHVLGFKVMSEGTTGYTYSDILTFTCTEVSND